MIRYHHDLAIQTNKTYINFVPVMGSIYLIKIVLKCIGMYLARSDTKHIWLESGMFGFTLILNSALLLNTIIAHPLERTRVC